jgi:DNA repair protein SbcD/Mre11
MRFLHTSDWHVGKLLGGRPRIDEHRAVLGEIVEIAGREAVDAVLVVGDMFETAAPTPEATALVYDTLLALRATGAAVVVVGGNHDHQHQLDAVAPLFRAVGVTMLGLPTGRDNAHFEIVSRNGKEHALVAALPWVSQRWAVRSEQLMDTNAAGATQYYAARVANLLEWLCEGFGPETVNVIVAHAMVRGGVLGGGERDAQLIDEYAVPAAAFPVAANYVALGHLHRTQHIPAAAPVWYSGSPIQVDFGEEADVKRVLLVDAPTRGATKVKPIALTRGWALRTIRGTFAELEAMAGTTGDAWLKLRVREQPRPGLAEDLRDLFPQAVSVEIAREPRAREPDIQPKVVRRRGMPPRELFTEYLDHTGHARDERVLALFDTLLDETTDPERV